MSKYAARSSVSIDKSQIEIKKILAKYGATSFAYAEQARNATILFEMSEFRIKIILPLPPNPSEYATQASMRTFDQLCRTKWRCLVLAVKSKLECVESGITTLEQEFMPHIVLPNGQTVGQAVLPQIAQSYKDGKMPPLLGYSQ